MCCASSDLFFYLTTITMKFRLARESPETIKTILLFFKYVFEL